MLAINFTLQRNQNVRVFGYQLQLARQLVFLNDTLDFGPPFGSLPARRLAQAAEYYVRFTANTCAPQLAALVFGVTTQPRALDWYFPITNFLSDAELAQFDALRDSIAVHPNFDLRLMAEGRADLTSLLAPEIRQLVASHLAEIFFFRQDILDRFLCAPRHILLYATPQAFADDGGEAGGQYHSDRECVQLVLSRLFEGYNGETPGVAPFLHEFGHALDHFNAGLGRMGKSEGLLPGLRSSDGPIYTPNARALFIKGKRLERDRYMARYLGIANPADPLPIGHPYVFQNDTEFIAGYLEMYFRNPHYFAQLNPDLFNAFAESFGYDTRRGWKKDFPFYVEGNREFYRSGERPWPPGITIPKP